MREIIDIANRIAIDKFDQAEGGFVSIRAANGMFITRDKADMNTVTEADIQEVSKGANLPKEHATHMAIYQAMPQVNVIMHLKPYFCNEMSIANISPYAYLEDYAEVMGHRIAMTTSVPYRVVDTLTKQGACLVLNNGLFMVGKSIEGTYAKATLVERAALTYLILKLLDAENDSIQLQSKVIHNKRIKYLRNRDASPMPSSYSHRQGQQYMEQLNKLSPNLLPLSVDIPIFGGIIASSMLKVDEIMPCIEYGDLSGKKNKLNVIKLLEDNKVAVVKGRGIYSISGGDAEHGDIIRDVEAKCGEYIIGLLSDKYGSDNIDSDDKLMKLYINRISKN